MCHLLARISVHPWFIAALNLLFIFIIFNTIDDLIATHLFPYKEAEDIIEGVGVILIAWGVALEERNKLREVLGLLNRGAREDETYEEVLDENCHRYGLGLLLLGLFAEVGVECVKIPDRIINTAGIEGAVLMFSSFLLSAGGILMLRQMVFLIFKSKRVKNPGNEQ